MYGIIMYEVEMGYWYPQDTNTNIITMGAKDIEYHPPPPNQIGHLQIAHL